MNQDLSVLSWNVRGLNDAAHRELVRETTVCARPSVVCIQETKIRSMTRSILTETLGGGLTGHCALDANGTRGGILLGWDQDAVQITDIDTKLFTVTASVRMLASDAFFRLTTCYGPSDDR